MNIVGCQQIGHRHVERLSDLLRRGQGENLRREIYDKRYPDLEDNPRDLPQYIGPGERLRDTVRGHETLLNIKLQQLKRLEDRYARECGGK